MKCTVRTVILLLFLLQHILYHLLPLLALFTQGSNGFDTAFMSCRLLAKFGYKDKDNDIPYVLLSLLGMYRVCFIKTEVIALMVLMVSG